MSYLHCRARADHRTYTHPHGCVHPFIFPLPSPPRFNFLIANQVGSSSTKYPIPIQRQSTESGNMEINTSEVVISLPYTLSRDFIDSAPSYPIPLPLNAQPHSILPGTSSNPCLYTPPPPQRLARYIPGQSFWFKPFTVKFYFPRASQI